MKSFLLPLAVLASSAMAQTTSACGADYIVDACLSSERAKLEACKGTDYGCQCAQWQNIITCYNNCPNDPRQHSSAGQRDIFCGYASQFPSSSSTIAAPSKTTSTPAKSTGNTEEGQNSASASQSGTGTATSSSNGAANTNSAADLALNAGSVLAAVAGVAAFIL
ncbi:hypothetical protein C8A05DRAFT_29388 [Staphylotrichum tortipilum]|uniref:GPI anchored serine-threonine rich protein n=1 Tax=Staphylotrichum tortipilum TaxID=2831512 RepID=A0AAN6MUA4_9PEZI|nr:hypothetical protein C8A05DRAFT_29388 [Staphylotrichum longicolle]